MSEFQGLLVRLKKMDRQWRNDALLHLSQKLEDHDWWQAEGQPHLDCWIAYKGARMPGSTRHPNRRGMDLKKLARYGIADPGPMTQDEWNNRGGRKAATWLNQNQP